MSEKATYFHLHTNTMNPCTIADEADAANWLCLGCNYPKPGLTSVDATIQAPEPQGAPLNFVFGCGVAIARRRFLESLHDIVAHDLYLGRVFLDNGVELSDWATFRGKVKLIVRGSKNVSYRVCDKCGRNVYFGMGTRYLFPAPTQEHWLFESDLSGLIVSAALLDRIALSKWPKLLCDKLPVYTSPKDGLIDLKSFYAWE